MELEQYKQYFIMRYVLTCMHNKKILAPRIVDLLGLHHDNRIYLGGQTVDYYSWYCDGLKFTYKVYHPYPCNPQMRVNLSYQISENHQRIYTLGNIPPESIMYIKNRIGLFYRI